MSRRLRFTPPAVLFASALGAFAADNITQVSPFLPAPGTVTATATTPKDMLEFAGVSTIQQQTIVSIYNTQEKRGRWIAVGGSAEGIEVLSYDANNDQVVIRHGGQVKVLKLREPSQPIHSGFAPANTPGPAMAPVATLLTPNPPAEARKPLTLAEHGEARMFVADMLDIGMQTRNAHEEAQKKAAAEKAANAAKANAATPQSTAPVPAPASTTTPPSGG